VRGEIDHSIMFSESGLQLVEIEQIDLHGLGAHPGELATLLGGPTDARDLMSALDQQWNCTAPDYSGRAGNEDFH
jgi:hypothetical protein